ncbi:hypothetical protein QVD17_01604 [Tagetes erecta]|uniref:Protein kinase domain-containing protein n=1 Tax=Tagetes erecta TaxID=13708 RepID=A0AAD8L7S8_TARER|nr:hypothetical protein QVD17_01604 [Tagetes erecta]
MASPLLLAVAASIASFFIITLIVSIIFFICQFTKKHRRTTSIPIRNTSTVISISDSQMFDPSLNKIDMVDLVNATRNFSPDLIVGDGSFGYVYKAHLAPGSTVAVKKLAADAFHGYREFKAEMETLGKIRHDNIVNLFGYCATGSDRVLIYEFIEKGSLDQWLYDTSSDGLDTSALRLPLSWRTRVNIVKGVAKGLSFMHSLEEAIIHRDIKASNVLLDVNFNAHIADFGLARRIDSSHSHVSTQVAGTMGYLPPEYFHGGGATVMGDVYSFGMLMFEVATCRRPNLKIKDENGVEVRFVEWAMSMVSQNQEMKMLDVRISKDDLDENEVKEFFRIATFCTVDSPRLRPSMHDIVHLFYEIQDETSI